MRKTLESAIYLYYMRGNREITHLHEDLNIRLGQAENRLRQVYAHQRQLRRRYKCSQTTEQDLKIEAEALTAASKIKTNDPRAFMCYLQNILVGRQLRKHHP
jgi:hypothetical protein